MPSSDPGNFPMVVDKNRSRRYLHIRHAVSFFIFGLINNVLYVIILSAALDLLPPSTPKGVIAFCNIAPALVAKVAWPIFSRGQIRYTLRIASCCAMAVTGMILVASFDSLSMRLIGISLASFASGLGEITYLQLSTVYRPSSVAGRAVSAFASGTGAAGLVGAFMWWELRGLGVQIGVGISSILPFLMPMMYHLVLPAPEILAVENDMDVLYQPISSTLDEEEDQEQIPTETTIEPTGPAAMVSLTKEDKWRLTKPLLLKYMLPLFCVYCFEYTINQGVAPTLVWPVPNVSDHAILGRIIHSVRDYYPLWQLVYQTTVFISRSSISLGLPALPRRLIALPALIQGLILATLSAESAFRIFGDDLTTYSTAVFLVFMLISFEGLCGGLAYVNVFYHINQQAAVSKIDGPQDAAKAKQEKEFQIGAIGLADSTGILVAALLAVPTEVALCRIQVNHGRSLCKEL